MESINPSTGLASVPQIILANDKSKPVIENKNFPQSKDLGAMPDKRDIVNIKTLGGELYGAYGSSSNFIKQVSSDILISKEETEIKVLNDKLSSPDVTDAQKTILEAMLKEAQGRLTKLQKEQGVL